MVRITITNQSFEEAGGANSFPNLSLAGIVYGQRVLGEGKVETMNRADISLEAEAIMRGLSCVFKVEHQLNVYGRPSNNFFECFSYGSGYRVKSK
jgi:hypothetical protein